MSDAGENVTGRREDEEKQENARAKAKLVARSYRLASESYGLEVIDSEEGLGWSGKIFHKQWN